MLKGHAFEKFHRDEGLTVVLADFIDRADVGMVQRRSRAGFPPETFKRVGIAGHVSGKELKGDKAAQAGVFGLVDYAHASAAEFFDDAVVRDGLPDHWAEILGLEAGQVNEGNKVGGVSARWLLITVGTPITGCPPYRPGRALISASGSYLG